MQRSRSSELAARSNRLLDVVFSKFIPSSPGAVAESGSLQRALAPLSHTGQSADCVTSMNSSVAFWPSAGLGDVARRTHDHAVLCSQPCHPASASAALYLDESHAAAADAASPRRRAS